MIPIWVTMALYFVGGVLGLIAGFWLGCNKQEALKRKVLHKRMMTALRDELQEKMARDNVPHI